MKQTKLIKFMLVVLILVPTILLITAVVQTFVLKDAQKKLTIANEALTKTEQEYNHLNKQHDYVYNEDGSLSEDYLKEHYKHGDGSYGNDGDIDIIIK